MSRDVLLSLVLLLFVSAGSSGCEPELDIPWVVAADAWCDSTDPASSSEPLPFDIWAQVDHDRGPEAVAEVWVDVSFVDYDNLNGTLFLTPIASFDLSPMEDVGQWWVTVPSGETPLDCAYDFEYHFLFTVMDDDGDYTQADLIN